MESISGVSLRQALYATSQLAVTTIVLTSCLSCIQPNTPRYEFSWKEVARIAYKIGLPNAGRVVILSIPLAFTIQVAIPWISYQIQDWIRFHRLTKCTLYAPLPGPKSIRLLLLQPGETEEPICQSFIYSVGRWPSYDALSYTWGGEKKTKQIKCNSTDFPVTPNLCRALKRLRDPEEPRLIWVDAICINQDDDDERGQQVRIMSDIYGAARKVIIWLGEVEETPNAKTVITETLPYIARLSRSMARDRKPLVIPGVVALDPTAPNQDEDHIGALSAFFERAWFERAWIIQEVVLAKAIEVRVGELILQWDDIVSCARLLSRHSNYNWPSITRILFINHWRMWRRDPWLLEFSFEQAFDERWIESWLSSNDDLDEHSFRTLLALVLSFYDFLKCSHRFILGALRNRFSQNLAPGISAWRYIWLSHMMQVRDFKASVSTDMVYCLLAIPPGNLLTEFPPDYKLCVIETFKRFTRYHIAELGGLDILGHVRRPEQPYTQSQHLARSCRHCQHEKVTSVQPLPTWTLDWTLPPVDMDRIHWSNKHNGFYNASRGLAPQIQYLEADDVMKVRGIRFDTITAVGPIYCIDSKNVSERASTPPPAAWERQASELKSYPNGDPLRWVFAFTLIGGASLSAILLNDSKHRVNIDAINLWFLCWYMKYGNWHLASKEEASNFPELMDWDQQSQNACAYEYQYAIQKHSIGQVFFTTQKGYMGLGGLDCKPGDLVCILYGGRTPFILRRRSHEGTPRSLPVGDKVADVGDVDSETFEFIGDCYIHGIMYGETLDLAGYDSARDFLIK